LKLFSNAIDRVGTTRLKIGSRIMGVKNDNTFYEEVSSGLYFYNGILGVVVDVRKYHNEKGVERLELEVLYDNYPDETHFLTNSRIKFETKVQAPNGKWKRVKMEYCGIPVVTADALTIHKAQGKTLPCTAIMWDDLVACGETGMAYVAMSRCRYWENCFIVCERRRFDMRSAIKTDSVVKAFDCVIHGADHVGFVDEEMITHFKNYINQVKFNDGQEDGARRAKDLEDLNCKNLLMRNPNRNFKSKPSSLIKTILFDAETHMVRTSGFIRQTEVKGVDYPPSMNDGDVKKHRWYSVYARIYFPLALVDVYTQHEPATYSSYEVLEELRYSMVMVCKHCNHNPDVAVTDVFFLDPVIYDYLMERKFENIEVYDEFDKTKSILLKRGDEVNCLIVRGEENNELHTTFFNFTTNELKNTERAFLGKVKNPDIFDLGNASEGEKVKTVKSALNACKKPYVLSAANGAGFDFQWFQQYFQLNDMENNNYSLNPLLRSRQIIGGRMYSDTKIIDVGTVLDKQTKKRQFPVWGHPSKTRELTYYVFHDLLQLLSPGTSLKKNHLSYCSTKNYTKDIFPHKLVLKSSLIKSFDLSRKALYEDYFDNDVESHWKYHKLNVKYPEITEGQVMLDRMIEEGVVCSTLVEQLIKYNHIDVQMMEDIYHEIDSITMEHIERPAVNVTTSTSLAQRMFMHITAKSKYGPLFLGDKPLKKVYEDSQRNRSSPTVLVFPSKEHETFLRKGIYGGRCLRRVCWIDNEYTDGKEPENYAELKTKDTLVAMDINSMYGECLRANDYPVGPTVDLTALDIRNLQKALCHRYFDPVDPEAQADLKRYFFQNKKCYRFFALKIDAIPNKHNIEPSVPRKDGDDNIQWDCKPLVKQVYVSVHIYLLLRSGGVITKIHNGVCWPERPAFPLFEQYMEIALQFKRKGDQMNSKEPGTGEAIRSFGKLLGNGLYGWTLQKNEHVSTIICKEIKDFSDFFQKYEYDSHEYICKNTFVFVGRKLEDVEASFAKSLSYLGAYVLAYSHLMFDNFVDVMYGSSRYEGSLNSIKNQMYYSDTDSFYVLPSMVARLVNAGLVMDTPTKEEQEKIINTRGSFIKPDGYVKDDYQEKGYSCIREWDYVSGLPTKCEFTQIYAFTAVAKKCYALKTISPRGNSNSKAKQKGVPISSSTRSSEEPTNFLAIRYRYDEIIKKVKSSIKWLWKRHDNNEYFPDLSFEEKVRRKDEIGFMPNAFSASFLKSGILTNNPLNSNIVYQNIINRGANWNQSRARQHVSWYEKTKRVIQYTVPNGWEPKPRYNQFLRKCKFEFCGKRALSTAPKQESKQEVKVFDRTQLDYTKKQEMYNFFLQRFQLEVRHGHQLFASLRNMDETSEEATVSMEECEYYEDPTVVEEEKEEEEEEEVDDVDVEAYRQEIRRANALIDEADSMLDNVNRDCRAEEDLEPEESEEEIEDLSIHYSNNPFIESEAYVSD